MCVRETERENGRERRECVRGVEKKIGRQRKKRVSVGESEIEREIERNEVVLRSGDENNNYSTFKSKLRRSFRL